MWRHEWEQCSSQRWHSCVTLPLSSHGSSATWFNLAEPHDTSNDTNSFHFTFCFSGPLCLWRGQRLLSFHKSSQRPVFPRPLFSWLSSRSGQAFWMAKKVWVVSWSIYISCPISCRWMSGSCVSVSISPSLSPLLLMRASDLPLRFQVSRQWHRVDTQKKKWRKVTERMQQRRKEQRR